MHFRSARHTPIESAHLGSDFGSQGCPLFVGSGSYTQLCADIEKLVGANVCSDDTRHGFCIGMPFNASAQQLIALVLLSDGAEPFFSLVSKTSGLSLQRSNLAFRKEQLLSCKTLGEYGKLLSGVESILLNRSSRKGGTAVCLHPEALLLESREPSEEPWTNELLYQKETERYYAHKQGYQWSKCILAIFSWLLFLLSLTCISLSIAYRHWEYTASTVVLLLIWMFLRARRQKENARLFQIKSAGLYLPFYDLRLWCLNQATSIRYAFKDRKIFYRKLHP